MTEKALTPRQMARQYAVRGLYQWELNKAPAEKIVSYQQSLAESQRDKVDLVYMNTLITNTISVQSAIDVVLSGHVSRPLQDVDPVELSILRVAGYEMMEEMSVPCSVIVNEAIELAKYFSGEKSYQFINGVLDKAGKVWRTKGGV